MDSLYYGNRPNICGNPGSLTIPQSFGERADANYDEIGYSNDSNFSVSGNMKNAIFVGPNDDDRSKFFTLCAENNINALIERVREFEDNFGRPEEFENEAVSMAIQQHGLRKNDSQSISYVKGSGDSTKGPDTKSLPARDTHFPATSNEKFSSGDIVKDERGRRNKRKRQSDYSEAPDMSESGVSKQTFDFNDMYFIDEAVATAIEEKGLWSSSFSILK